MEYSHISSGRGIDGCQFPDKRKFRAFPVTIRLGGNRAMVPEMDRRRRRRRRRKWKAVRENGKFDGRGREGGGGDCMHRYEREKCTEATRHGQWISFCRVLPVFIDRANATPRSNIHLMLFRRVLLRARSPAVSIAGNREYVLSLCLSFSLCLCLSVGRSTKAGRG